MVNHIVRKSDDYIIRIRIQKIESELVIKVMTTENEWCEILRFVDKNIKFQVKNITDFVSCVKKSEDKILDFPANNSVNRISYNNNKIEISHSLIFKENIIEISKCEITFEFTEEYLFLFEQIIKIMDDFEFMIKNKRSFNTMDPDDKLFEYENLKILIDDVEILIDKITYSYKIAPTYRAKSARK